MFASRTAAFSGDSLSQERIYRCGNEYTNSPVFAEAHGCKLLETVNRTALKKSGAIFVVPVLVNNSITLDFVIGQRRC
jgi:hypothetical protein